MIQPSVTWERPAERVLDADDLRFIERALETWAAWALTGFSRVASVALYDSATEEHRTATIALSDDQLTEIDRVVARLPFSLRDMIEIHYRATQHLPMAARYRQLGIGRDRYLALLLEAHTVIYNALPHIEDWRKTIL